MKTICTEKTINFIEKVVDLLNECTYESEVRPLFKEAIADDKEKEDKFFN